MQACVVHPSSPALTSYILSVFKILQMRHITLDMLAQPRQRGLFSDSRVPLPAHPSISSLCFATALPFPFPSRLADSLINPPNHTGHQKQTGPIRQAAYLRTAAFLNPSRSLPSVFSPGNGLAGLAPWPWAFRGQEAPSRRRS